MIRFSLLVILRSILLFLVVIGVYRLLRSTIASFIEGLRGQRPVQPSVKPPHAEQPTIEYHDVKDARFEEKSKVS